MIRAHIRVKVGDPYRSLATDDDVRDLYATGLFYNIRVTGDNTPDGVVLWTRLAPEPERADGGLPPLPVTVRWEVSDGPAFARIVRHGQVVTGPERAHSVHVEVEGLEPGDVLAIAPDGRLARTSEAFQESVAGVYSTRPAFLGGDLGAAGAAGKVPLVIAGVVPVKASAEAGPIRPGDRLVASATPGHAMRVDRAAPSGCIIGKALTGLASGSGTVTMLAMLQ